MELPVRRRVRTVVVAAASRHGTTAAIAERVAHGIVENLSQRWVVRTPDLADLRVLDDVDAFVLGSAVHLGHWLRPALKLRRQAHDSRLLGLWLFSSGPVSHSLDQHPAVVSPDDLVRRGQAIEHRVFVPGIGVVASRRRPSPGNEVVPEQDHDWAAIDAWGVNIAARLTCATAGTDVPAGRVCRPWADRAAQKSLEARPTTGSSPP